MSTERSHSSRDAKSHLTQAIIDLSEADSWDRARLEWVLEDIYHEEIPDTCLCGHFPINELCYLRNRINRNLVLVGNVCVKRFLGLPSDRLFAAIQRVALDSSRSLNLEAIEHAFGKSWINRWEHEFCMNTWRKRVLSGKQRITRERINAKVLRMVKNARGSAG